MSIKSTDSDSLIKQYNHHNQGTTKPNTPLTAIFLRLESQDWKVTVRVNQTWSKATLECIETLSATAYSFNPKTDLEQAFKIACQIPLIKDGWGYFTSSTICSYVVIRSLHFNDDTVLALKAANKLLKNEPKDFKKAWSGFSQVAQYFAHHKKPAEAFNTIALIKYTPMANEAYKEVTQILHRDPEYNDEYDQVNLLSRHIREGMN